MFDGGDADAVFIGKHGAHPRVRHLGPAGLNGGAAADQVDAANEVEVVGWTLRASEVSESKVIHHRFFLSAATSISARGQRHGSVANPRDLTYNRFFGGLFRFYKKKKQGKTTFWEVFWQNTHLHCCNAAKSLISAQTGCGANHPDFASNPGLSPTYE
jgi:hypothetical protein